MIYNPAEIAGHAQLNWVLTCLTHMGFMERMHSYKEALDKGKAKEISVGVFCYPILMAADILMYDVDIVPVGKDQKQHVEMARDMAGSFNHSFGGDFIKLAEPLIDEKVMTIPGLDGQKMSKSYNNVVPMFVDEKALRKIVLSLKTDSTALEAEKSMKGTILGELFSLFATTNEAADLEARLNKGGLGWGHAKDELFQAINREIGPIRTRYNELRADEKFLLSELEKGARRAFEIGSAVLNRVRKAVGEREFALHF